MTSAQLGVRVDGDFELRMLQPADLSLTRAWRNHSDSRIWFHSPDVISSDQHRAWFERYLERDDDYTFIVEHAGSPVAQVALYDIADRSAEFGRLLIDPAMRGRGLSHRVTALCLQVGEEELDLTTVHLEVITGNASAIATYRRAGFVVDPDAVGTPGSIVMRRGPR